MLASSPPSSLITAITKAIATDNCDASDGVRRAAFVARRLLCREMPPLVGKIFRNIAMFPIFRHLAKTEKKYRQFGYEMST